MNILKQWKSALKINNEESDLTIYICNDSYHFKGKKNDVFKITQCWSIALKTQALYEKDNFKLEKWIM